MGEPLKPTSLLPYLTTGPSGTRLEVSLVSKDPATLEKTHFPFLTVSDSDPLSRIIEGRFVTDTGDRLKTVFMLMQRDEYRIAREELWPVTNVDVASTWERARQVYAVEGEPRLVSLSAQADEGGRYRPFSPLFFCKSTRTFFRPPCPACGRPLELCTDDGLLIGAGLQPYFRSLKRYLSCASCGASRTADFYAYGRDPQDPPELSDRWALMRAYRSLVERPDTAGRLPCAACLSRERCFGSDLAVLSRVVPFSFYPFYAMFLDAMSLEARDFLTLLSGETPRGLEERLESTRETVRLNRLRSVETSSLPGESLLFGHDPRFFLEVLYLKLSFLGQLLEALPGTDRFGHPDLRPSLDRVWVRLSDKGSFLPSFWSFKVGMLDLGGFAAASPDAPQPAALSGSYLPGLLWFYTFLVNRKQDATKISSSLGRFIAEGHEPAFTGGASDAVFSPFNIFFDPGERAISVEWFPPWERTMRLGWYLLKSGTSSQAEWSEEAFWREFRAVREQTFRALMHPASKVDEPYAPPLSRAEDRLIHEALREIGARWRAGQGHETNADMSASPDEVDQAAGLQETVVLHDRNGKQVAGTAPPEPEMAEILPETVILSSSGAGMQKTGREGEVAKKAPVESAIDNGEFLAETVILTLPYSGKRKDTGEDHE